MPTVTQSPPVDAFRTVPARGLPAGARIDRKTRTIYGAKAIELGPLNEGDSRQWSVDMATLTQVRDFCNGRPQGAKMRFAHPNMSRDGLGHHVGRASNARIIQGAAAPYVAVDCKLLDAAARSPRGNLAGHILDLAEEAPESFGLSIATSMDHEGMKKLGKDAEGLTPIRLRALRAIDFVDEPAATRGGLFATDSLFDLADVATDFLDTHFAGATREAIEQRFSEFLTAYFKTKGATVFHTPTISPQAAAAELVRVQQLTSLFELAGVDDGKLLNLMLAAGWDSATAQNYLATNGYLVQRPAFNVVSFDREYNESRDLFQAMGLSAESYRKSRCRDEGLPLPEAPGQSFGFPAQEKAFAAEYSSSRDVFEKLGVNRDQYIRSRLVDAGPVRLAHKAG